MNKPYVICHMMTSLDGKITGPFFGIEESYPSGEFYDERTRELAPMAWGCGRLTYLLNYPDDLDQNLLINEKGILPEGDYVLKKEDDDAYCVVFDRKGRLNWIHDRVEYPEGYHPHVLEVVTKEASPSYLLYLRKIGIPYIIAGDKDLDIPLFLKKLHEEFGVERFALCGGGNINGSFFKENLVDEISIVIAPVYDGGKNDLSIALSDEASPRAYKLKGHSVLSSGGIYLEYVK
ncbi:MAG: dihydrofolate reductase family protein [Bacilli bacterium]|jgi:riboflavin biosynthesis pyrimidine reductase|nr:dihydrofolate reductase family protein [Bacilli bacterium]MCH4277662.1 dihydrofolate reductase family protein [Bacilli bacterium]